MRKVGLKIGGYIGYQFLFKFSGIQDISYVMSYDSDRISFDKVQFFCRKMRIPCYYKADSDLPSADIIFAVGWQYFLTDDLHKTVVLHDSYLPKKRGWCPTPTSLIRGDRYLGVTAFMPTKNMDDGPIFKREKIRITYPITSFEAYEKIVDRYIVIASKILSGKIKRLKLQKGEPTYSIWRDEQDYIIDWNRSAREINRKIDALSFPFDGAVTYSDGFEYRIIDAEEVPDVEFAERHPGKVFYLTHEDKCPVVICGEGLLKIRTMFFKGEIVIPRKLKRRFT